MGIYEFVFGKEKKPEVYTVESKHGKFGIHGKYELPVVKKTKKCIDGAKTKEKKESCVENYGSERNKYLVDTRFEVSTEGVCKALLCKDDDTTKECNVKCKDIKERQNKYLEQRRIREKQQDNEEKKKREVERNGKREEKLKQLKDKAETKKKSEKKKKSKTKTKTKTKSKT